MEDIILLFILIEDTIYFYNNIFLILCCKTIIKKTKDLYTMKTYIISVGGKTL